MNIKQLENLKKVTKKQRIMAKAWITVQNGVNEKSVSESSGELEEALIGECIEANLIDKLIS